MVAHCPEKGLMKPTLNLVPKLDKKRDNGFDDSRSNERSRSPEAEQGPYASDCEAIMDVIKIKGEVHE